MATALYWSGGKDCTLALLDSLEKGLKFDYFITFVGEDVEFRCHPICIMKEQSRQFGVPHLFYVIRDPYMPSFAQAIRYLSRNHGINCVVTGDLIKEGSDKFEQYWLQKYCLKEGVKLLCPMGNITRRDVLQRTILPQMDVRVSGVHLDLLPVALLWRKFTIHEMQLMLDREQSHIGFDIAGENGEYHTSVLACDVFHVPMPQLSTVVGTHYEVAYLPLLTAHQQPSPHVHHVGIKESCNGRRWIASSIPSKLARIRKCSDRGH
jgi:diphthamide synthase (EF-2-diphthine--ammonia ligase)